MRPSLDFVNVRPLTSGLAALACLILTTGLFLVRATEPLAPLFRFRLVVSAGVVGADVNEGDAQAAMQAWRDAVVKDQGFIIDVHVSELPNLVREVRDRQVDGFSLTTLEYLQVEKYASQSLVTDEVNIQGGDEYLILAHEDSGLRTLADLRHKSLAIYDNPKMCLAPMWLDTLLASSNLGAPRDFLGVMTKQNKISRAVLPVYFRQADACLVTKRAFSTMCELNPQLGHKLRVLANSPKFVTTLMAFHKDCPPDRRLKCQNALIALHKNLAGQQALTLFESGPLALANSSILRTSFELAKAYDRIRAAVPSGRK